MTDFADLSEVIESEHFPEVDVALRQGRHLDRHDGELYTYMLDAAGHLEVFYRRFGCELCKRPDGYFYLIPHSEKVSKRQLSAIEMLVGQALALLFLDPRLIAGDDGVLGRSLMPQDAHVDAAESPQVGAVAPAESVAEPREPDDRELRAGVVTQGALTTYLTSLLGRDALLSLLTPGRKRVDERVAEEQARSRIREGVRKLSLLGFVQLVHDQGILLRPALLRFADPVRGTKDPSVALAQLVASGEVVMEASEASQDVERNYEADTATEADAPEDDEPTVFPGARAAQAELGAEAELGAQRDEEDASST
jgi:chromosome partition protein MukE